MKVELSQEEISILLDWYRSHKMASMDSQDDEDLYCKLSEKLY